GSERYGSLQRVATVEAADPAIGETGWCSTARATWTDGPIARPFQRRQVDRPIRSDGDVTGAVRRWHPIRISKIKFCAERTDGHIQRDGFVVAAEIGKDLGLAVAPRIHAHANARRPVVGERIVRVHAVQVLLLPAQAGIDGDVLVDGPAVLRE